MIGTRVCGSVPYAQATGVPNAVSIVLARLSRLSDITRVYSIGAMEGIFPIGHGDHVQHNNHDKEDLIATEHFVKRLIEYLRLGWKGYFYMVQKICVIETAENNNLSYAIDHKPSSYTDAFDASLFMLGITFQLFLWEFSGILLHNIHR